jgi:WD40 repeat protein
LTAGRSRLCQRTAAGWQKETTFAGHAVGVLSLAFSPHGDKVLSGSRDGMVRLWNLTTLTSRRSFFGILAPCGAAFSPDGQQVVTAGDDASVRLWRIGDETPRVYRGHDGPVYAVAFAPQGGWIASGGRDRDVHVWRAEKDLRIKYDDIARDLEQQRRGEKQPPARAAFHSPDFRLRGHAGDIRSLAFSNDGTLVLSGAHDNTVRRWAFQLDPQRPEYMTTFRGHGGWVRGCVLALDPRYAVSGSLDGFVKLWDADEYEEVRARRNHGDASELGGVLLRRPADRHRQPRSAGARLEPRQPRAGIGPGRGKRARKQAGAPAARLEEGRLPGDERRVFRRPARGDQRPATAPCNLGPYDRRPDAGGSRHGTLGVLALSSDGRWVITGSDTTDARALAPDDATVLPVRLSGHRGEIAAAGFSGGTIPSGREW